jgi:hypothetical protein
LRLETVDGSSQGSIGNVTRVRSSGGTWKTKEDLDIGVLCLSLSPIVPGIKVEATTLDRAVVVIELNPDKVEPGIVQSIAEVSVREWALWSTSDIVILRGVRSYISSKKN